MYPKLTQENRFIDLPDLNRFQIGDEVIVDASADNDRFEGVIIGIELRRLHGSEYLVPSITILHDGYITDEFKPIDCRKVIPSPSPNVRGPDDSKQASRYNLDGYLIAKKALQEIADFRERDGSDPATVEWNRAGCYARDVAKRALAASPSQQTVGDGEAAIIECLAAGQNFVFDPATNFLHADDGTVQGIRYIAEHGDLPQSPWPASDWAIDRIKKLETALKPFARIADMEEKTPAGDSTLVNIDRCREARVVLAATTEGQP